MPWISVSFSSSVIWLSSLSTRASPVTTGTLWAEAREVSKNFKLGSYTVEVKDDQGELVAVFQGLAYRKSETIPA